MAVDRIKIKDIISSQVPAYVKDDFPLLVSFLEEYYNSQETQGGTLDLIHNLDQYVKVDELAAIKLETTLGSDLNILSKSITLSPDTNFTYNFPDENGIIMIDDEIIKYGHKTDTTFENCVRGFSGVTQYVDNLIPDKLKFKTSRPATHKEGAVVKNLSVLFLQEFFNKIKTQFTPGFENRSLASGLNQKNFVKESDSFYKSKGTDESFKILFKSIYGVDVEILKPDDFLIRSSDANYLVSNDFVIEKYIGDPLLLKNRTVYQKSTNARGTVTKVEKLNVDGDFYQISIDTGYQRDVDVDGTIFGKFEPNPKTKLLNNVSVGSTIFDVDSTVDFPSSGSLSVVDSNGFENIISYADKNLTQFIGVTTTTSSFIKTVDVRKNDYTYATIGDNGNQIRFRILSSLKNIEYTTTNFGLEVGDRISVKTIGIEDNNLSDWYYNVKSKLNVKNITLVNIDDNVYQIIFEDNHDLKVSYNIVITDENLNTSIAGKISSIDSDKILNIKLDNAIAPNTLTNRFSIENQLQKGNSIKFPELQNFNANILNIYKKNNKYLIASNSIPNYADNIRCDNKTFTFSGSANFDIITLTTSSDHGLYSGDSVYYSPSRTVTTSSFEGQTFEDVTVSKFTNLDEGVYFIQRIDSFNIRLAKSQSDLYNQKYIIPSGTVNDNKFTYYPFYQKSLNGQKIYREIDEPIQEAGKYITKPGKTGILINGVEISNYKSSDVIFYGGIDSFEITSPGKNYDVINPPILNIVDGSGVGAEGSISVEGTLTELKIINKGFDYIEKPFVKIEGGNPRTSASAEVNLTEIDHTIEFNAGIIFNNLQGGVDIANDIIGFSTFHNLRDIEQIVYNSNPNPVTGLGTDQIYFAKVIDSTRISLFSNFGDANLGINTVSLTALGNGTQSFSTVNKKKVVSSINVVEPGSGYRNQQRTIRSSGISTAQNLITIKNHGYETNDIIQYTLGTTTIGGISTNTDYFVEKVDNDSFYLYDVGNQTLGRRYYIDNKIIKNISSVGDGSFNYKPITVTVEGQVGLNTSFGQNINCIVEPIFRGSITGADVITSGVGYGSSEILNFDRNPIITLQTGSGAQLTPIVNNGSITEVVVNNGGSGYNSIPKLTVTLGSYCQLTPIINNGVITSVNVINGGINYRNDSQIIIEPSGNDGSVAANIQQWTINKFEQSYNNLTDDDCIIDNGSINKTTQISHLYAPRNLRKSLYGNKSNRETQYQHPDLKILNGFEVDSKYHSPIIGWAYDGSPIYGPYGYDKPSGGPVRSMVSGYEIEISNSRPPLNLYPIGFFVEDYVFRGTGDLNESNGRFCITPEYPNGKFVYFATISNLIESNGPFKNLKKPAFPYLIGNTFQHKQNEFNFKKISNHVDYDLVENNWRRITTPYKINSKFGGYDYIFNSNNVKEQIIEITGISQGSVDSVGIFTGGDNYKIDDKINFSESINGKNARAKVSSIGGKKVNNISVLSDNFTNIEFVNVGYSNKFVGFMSSPHNLKDQEKIKIDGLSQYFAGLDGSYNIGINTGSYVLLNDVDTSANTGLVTYFSVGGAFQYPFMRPNDIIIIESEKIKILNSDPLNNRVRVLRAQEGTTGTAHTGNIKLFQDPRSFSINVGSLKTTKLLRQNNEFYFDPNEALGIGSDGSIGAGKTLTFSNPGAGITTIFAPERLIYLPGHTFKLNDIVTYNRNGGSSITVWNGKNQEPITNLSTFTSLYVAPVSNNFIGLSSTKIGLGSTGYTGISDPSIGLLYFTGIGTDVYHSLKTNIDEVVKGRAERTKVTVSVAGTHGLFVGDEINLSLSAKNQETVVVKYDDYNRRIVFDPYSFNASQVDTENNTIGVSTNTFKTGDKIIHTSTSPSGGLVDDKMYYVYENTSTSIKLVEEKFELNKISPNFVNITSASTGTLSKINPSVNAFTNIKFDLSDTSLSFISNSIKYPAFKMEIFTDSLFLNQYYGSNENENESESDFNVKTTGIVGTDGELTIDIKNIPSILYYKFTNVNESFIADVKKVVIDKNVNSHNTIFKSISKFDGNHTITSIGNTTFDFNLNDITAELSYDTSNSDAQYTTTSKNAFGSIKKIDLVDNNYGYKKIPSISSIVTGVGTGAILFAESTSIGQIRNQKFQSNNIGWNYPTDQTLKPTANLPEIVEVSPLLSFERIGISSSGVDYLVAPDLIVMDGYTKKIIDDCVIEYDLGDPEVNIVSNTRGIYPNTPRIIAINNSNGYEIGAVTLNETVVRLELTTQFNSDSEYPFAIGSKVYVENINIGVGTTGKGYNSNQYNHEYFEVVGVQTNAGGSGAYVEYTLKDKLVGSEIPGTVVSFNSARVIPVEHLPIFDPVLKENKFLNDEIVTWNSEFGVVDSYNEKTNVLKVKSQSDLSIGNLVTGKSSRTRGQVVKIFDFKGDINTGAGTTIYYGWQKNTGMLNEELQKIPNNEYYQSFSYSLKSPISFDTWNTTVGALNHTAGFKKFSDLQIEGSASASIETNESDLSFIVDCIGEGDLNCWYDYDNARENILDVNGKRISDTIFLENTILTDYFESQGNRVLRVDDVSEFFETNERSEAFSRIAEFDSTVKFTKSIFLVQDTTFTDERQFEISTVIVDEDSYMITYGKLHTFEDLGYFDVEIASEGWDFLFHPIKFKVNNYFVSSFDFAFEPELVGAGSSSFGDVVDFYTQEVNIPTNTVTNIVSVGKTYRSLKVMNLLVSADEYHFAEFNIVHNDTECSILEYNNIDETKNNYYDGGIGTYSAVISGSNVLLKFHPNTGIAATSYSQVVATSRGTNVTGFTSMTTARVGSGYTSIASSGSPTAHIVSSYDTLSFDEKYSASYQIVTVEDVANNHAEMFELGIINSVTIPTQQFTQFGVVETNAGLGTIGITTSGNFVNVVYTPNPNIAVQVRSFFVDLREIESGTELDKIDYNNNFFKTQTGNYFGTLNDVKKDFNLLHDGNPIFERQFDGVTGVDTSSNYIISPNHFFQSGEAIKYTTTGTSSRIGIVTTDFGGSVGSTSLLPTDLFAVKLNDFKIGFSTSAAAAQKLNPDLIQFDTVGAGSSHYITATKQNTKTLVSIDNMIQAPISRTGIGATLVSDIVFDVQLITTGITSISSNDVIKIDDEFMRVTSVTGSGTSIFVERPLLGTVIQPHSAGASIEKFTGNYNISGNTINFVSAPYGNIPLSSTTNSPDERDYAGITTRSSFNARVFTKRGVLSSSSETYNTNFVFDDISDGFTGVTSEFVLKSNGSNVTGLTTNTVVLVNNIFQTPQGTQTNITDEYLVTENSGITSFRFTGGIGSATSYDQNQGNLPVGGLIVSVGSFEGSGYQPLVGAGGTAVVSIAGTISSISIGNSGSGYRTGVVTSYNVGVQTYFGVVPILEHIGTAIVTNGNITSINITNPGSGYTSTNAPVVVIDEPLSYNNIPLINSTAGFGTGATVDIKVGQGSSVIDFEIKNFGYGYSKQDVLTVPTGGALGIPTDSSIAFSEFQITVQDIYSDSFNAFSIGEFQVLDRIDHLFDGVRRVFPLKLEDEFISIIASNESNIEVDQTLLVFINDILQVPGESYTFEGGSQITFNEAPKGVGSGIAEGDTSRILFYKGAGDSDVIFREVLETIKIGDSLKLNADVEKGQSIILNQNKRIVTGIATIDSARTNTYDGPGLSDTLLTRPLTWCKQTIDKRINGQFVSKDRIKYEPNIFPTSYLISPVSTSSTIAYVDSVRPLFDGVNESTNRQFQESIKITSQDSTSVAIATATIGAGNTITAINLTSGGSGYDFTPTVTIAGLGTFGTQATATATVTSGTVTGFTITNGGSNYTTPPLVIIEEPKISTETISINSYAGDSGVVVGLGSTNAGSQKQLFFDTYIPTTSAMRDVSLTGVAVTVSSLTAGDYVVIRDTYTSIGSTFASPVAVATTFLDCVYEVASATTEMVTVTNESNVGIVTSVRRIVCNVDNYGSGIAHTTNPFLGNYSWGKIQFGERINEKNFNFYGQNGVGGISTSGLVNRNESLKFKNYI